MAAEGNQEFLLFHALSRRQVWASSKGERSRPTHVAAAQGGKTSRSQQAVCGRLAHSGIPLNLPI